LPIADCLTAGHHRGFDGLMPAPLVLQMSREIGLHFEWGSEEGMRDGVE
jgi:hypothetical protein